MAAGQPAFLTQLFVPMMGADFLAVWADAMPSHAELVEVGLHDDEIASIQRGFRAGPAASLPISHKTRNELEKMILEHDCSSLEVGSIRFLGAPAEHPHGVVVTMDEADPLVVRINGTVAVYDHADDHFIIMECAPDSARFLDALAAWVGIWRERSAWKGRFDEAVELCASRAGGPAYQTFFQSRCGFLL